LGGPVPRAVGGGHKPQLRPYRAGPFEAVGILQGEHEGKCRDRPYALDLAQELRFWVVLFRDRIQLSVVGSDALQEARGRALWPTCGSS
jgi:hypothetical protein